MTDLAIAMQTEIKHISFITNKLGLVLDSQNNDQLSITLLKLDQTYINETIFEFSII